MGPRIAIALIAACWVLSGCGGGDEPTATTTSTPSGGEPLVKYVRSGGFAPVREALQVGSDGAATLDTGIRGGPRTHKDFTLGPAELERLREAIDAADLSGFVKATGVCADCYRYALQTPGGKVKFTDVDLGEGSDARVTVEVFDLLDVVSELVERNGPRRVGSATR